MHFFGVEAGQVQYEPAPGGFHGEQPGRDGEHRGGDGPRLTGGPHHPPGPGRCLEGRSIPIIFSMNILKKYSLATLIS